MHYNILIIWTVRRNVPLVKLSSNQRNSIKLSNLKTKMQLEKSLKFQKLKSRKNWKKPPNILKVLARIEEKFIGKKA